MFAYQRMTGKQGARERVVMVERIVIVGGVAGGASAAARARRLSESAEITLVERGPHVSFANCGLPYYVGGEISDQDDLLVSTPASLRARFNLAVRTSTEAVSIDTQAHALLVRGSDGLEEKLPYDKLVLSPGASPLRPPIAGIDRPGHFVVRNVPDALAIDEWIKAQAAQVAVVVGGGYIGLEMAEQLVHRGLKVAVVEVLDQVLAMLDPEMAASVHAELRRNHVDLHLADGVASFEAPAAGERAAASTVVLKSGTRLPADLVVLGMGVRPEVGLAKNAGLEIGSLGGIRVDEHMRTSDPDIYAVGDAVEVRNPITGAWSLLPLAGPANRQGRIAADHIMGRPSSYQGTIGTGIIRVFELTAAATGCNERALQRAGVEYRAVVLHPASHASYYPGAHPITLKVLFAPDTGSVLGAQAVGVDGVDKRIDVLAVAIKAKMTMDDLTELELAYAPPFGSAKDPVNLAGMLGQNVQSGLVDVLTVRDLAGLNLADYTLLDVREPGEWAGGRLPGAVHIPLGQLRSRINELPSDRPVIVYCRSGQRSYYACRILSQSGYSTRNLTGAYLSWLQAQA